MTLREPEKASLVDALWDKLELSADAKSGPTGPVQHVLDGGALLHRIFWPQQVTYEELCNKYCQYVLRRYGKQTIVVFDGYNSLTTKNITHQRRSAGKVSATVRVTFVQSMKVTMKRELFLANLENKKQFIKTLRRFLEGSGWPTFKANGNADTLIVKTAVEAASERPTVLRRRH